MIDLNERIQMSLEVSTIAILVAGLYCTFNNVDSMAIPSSLYIEIAEKLVPYLNNWDYEKLSFEDWIKYNLIILPKIMVEDEIDELKKNELYFERDNGNIMLVVTAEMV